MDWPLTLTINPSTSKLFVPKKVFQDSGFKRERGGEWNWIRKAYRIYQLLYSAGLRKHCYRMDVQEKERNPFS